MKYKGEECYSVTRAELLEAMQAGGVLRCWKFGPLLYDRRGAFPYKQLHPRRDTVLKLIKQGVLINSSAQDANQVQRECGLSTYRLMPKGKAHAQD